MTVIAERRSTCAVTYEDFCFLVDLYVQVSEAAFRKVWGPPAGHEAQMQQLDRRARFEGRAWQELAMAQLLDGGDLAVYSAAARLGLVPTTTSGMCECIGMLLAWLEGERAS